MPNKEGGYGGYSRQTRPPRDGRKVRAPGSGNVRRGVNPSAELRGTASRRAAPQEPDSRLESDWVRPEEITQRRVPYRAPSRPGNAGPVRRRQHRANRRLFVVATAAGILLLSGIITLLLPGADPQTGPVTAEGSQDTALADRLIAPDPYAGTQGSDGTAAVPAINWGTIGPVRQTDNITYTVQPAQPAAVPECGRVTTDWFSDAAFLGDSLTEGLAYYEINVGGALVLGYQGTSPNQIVNRTTLTNNDGEEQVPLDILAERQPAKLYVLLGTNALTGTGNDEGFLAYYGRMLDELKTTLPNAMIFVQSVLNVRPEAVEKAPGLAPDRLASINASIQQMCAEKGCYYLNLTEAFTGEDGYLTAEYAQTDGIHLTVSGYNKWIDYLCTHLPYNKSNPYQQGSTWYLTDELKQRIADLP